MAEEVASGTELIEVRSAAEQIISEEAAFQAKGRKQPKKSRHVGQRNKRRPKEQQYGVASISAEINAGFLTVMAAFEKNSSYYILYRELYII